MQQKTNNNSADIYVRLLEKSTDIVSLMIEMEEDYRDLADGGDGDTFDYKLSIHMEKIMEILNYIRGDDQ